MELTHALGHAVAHFGRLTLTSHDYAIYEPADLSDDDEEFNLHIAADRKALLSRHGFHADDLISHWKHESRLSGVEQRDAAQELWRDYHNSRGIRL